MKKLILGILVTIMMVIPLMVAPSVHAATCGKDQVETSILLGGGCQKISEDGDEIFKILNIALTTLTYVVGAAGTIGLVISGIQYMTSRDNAGQVAKAKMRILQIGIGLVAYALMFAFLSWLIPGGLI